MNEESKIFYQELDKLGCSDHHCWITGPRSGQHTNGRCHCLDSVADVEMRWKIRQAFELFQKEVRRLHLQIVGMLPEKI
jgi:hypothetical protein